MNIIDLATKTLQTAIKAVVDATKTKVDTIDTRTNTINTTVSSIKTTVEDTNADLAMVDALVDDLTTRLGIPTSAASNVTSGNTHAKLNWLLTNLATVNTNTATANLGTPTATASNATSAAAHAKLNWLLANVPTSIVKGVQFGTYTIPANGGFSDSPMISPVNINKSFLVFSIYEGVQNSWSISGKLESNMIRFKRGSSIGGVTEIEWRVIEFY